MGNYFKKLNWLKIQWINDYYILLIYYIEKLKHYDNWDEK